MHMGSNVKETYPQQSGTQTCLIQGAASEILVVYTPDKGALRRGTGVAVGGWWVGVV
jgi:hypothetical protein